MKGRLLDLSVGRNGKQRLLIELDGDFRETFDELYEHDVEAEIKKFRKKRSLNANSLMWSICEQIAIKTGTTKEEVYRHNIREVGAYTPLPIREDAVEEFSEIWSAHGTGWFLEIVDDSKLPNYKLVFAYQGSSTYDTKQMSRLIDNVIQDARALGIEVISDYERSLLLDAWAPNH